jgi:hypothetical protein
MKRVATFVFSLLVLCCFLTQESANAQLTYGEIIYVGQTTADLYTGPFDPTFTKIEFSVKGKLLGTIDNTTPANGLILTATGLNVGTIYVFEFKAYYPAGTSIKGTVANGYVHAGEIKGYLFRPDTLNKRSYFVDSCWVYAGGKMVIAPGADVADTIGLGSEEPRLLLMASGDTTVAQHGILEAYGGKLRHLMVESNGIVGPFRDFQMVGSDIAQHAPYPVQLYNVFMDRYSWDDPAHLSSDSRQIRAYNCTFTRDSEITGIDSLVKCTVSSYCNVYARIIDSCTIKDTSTVALPTGVYSEVIGSRFTKMSSMRFSNKSIVRYNTFDPTLTVYISALADGFDPADIADCHVNYNDFQRSGNIACTVSNTGADSIDATLNYWGKCQGPEAWDVSGKFIYKPFLRNTYPTASYWLNLFVDKDVLIANDDDEITFTGHMFNSLTAQDTSSVGVDYYVYVMGDTLLKGTLVTDNTGRFTLKFKLPNKYVNAGTLQVLFTSIQCIEQSFLISISAQSGPDIELTNLRIMQVQSSTSDIIAGKPFAVKVDVSNSEPVTTPFKVRVIANSVVYDTFYVESKTNLGLKWEYLNPQTQLTMPKIDYPTLVFFVNDPTIAKGTLEVKAIADPPDSTHPKGVILEANESNNTVTQNIRTKLPSFGTGGAQQAQIFIQAMDKYPSTRLDRLKTWSDSAKSFMESTWPMLADQITFSIANDVLDNNWIYPDSLEKETWQYFIMKSYKLMRAANPGFDRYVFALDRGWFRARLKWSNFDHRSTSMLNWSGIYDLYLATIEHNKYLVHQVGHSFGLRRGDIDPANPEEYNAFYSLGKEVTDAIDAGARRIKNYGQQNSAFQTLKTHCFMGGSRLTNTIQNWICDDDYNQLINTFSNLRGSHPLLSKSIVPKAMLIEGAVDSGTLAFSYGPWLRLNNAAPSIMCDSSFATHIFKVLDENSAELARYYYKPTFVSQGLDEDGLETDPKMEKEFFAFVIACPDNAKKIIVEHNGTTVRERVLTTNPPVVSIDSPLDGSANNPENGISASWSATDPDGETEFWYTVYLSTDNGSTWSLIQYECKTGSYLIPKTALGSGKNFKLRVVASDGLNTSERTISFTITAYENLPVATSMQLHQNFPNPFNPSTTITYELGSYAHATLIVYDAFGREVETLASGLMNPGSYSVDFNAGTHASGTYLAVLRSGDKTQTIRMTLTK